MGEAVRYYGIYMPASLFRHRTAAAGIRRMPAAGGSFLLRSYRMLDIAYLVVGAVFLGVCALYALACDHL